MAANRSTGRRWDAWLLVGWIALISVVRAGRFEETDPYWQARAGLEVLRGTPLARPDTWSWDPVPGLFLPNSPAWNVALGISWDRLGYWGLFAVAALSIAAYLVSVVLVAGLIRVHPLASIGALLVVLLLALPMLSARATLVAQTLFMLGLGAAFVLSRRLPQIPTLVGGALALLGGFLLSWAGNWIHLSWTTFALLSAGCWAILWLLAPGVSMVRAISASVAGAAGLLVGILLGPFGWDVWSQTQAVVAACSGLILEWTTPLHRELAARWLAPTLISTVLVAMTVAWILRTALVRPGRIRSLRLIPAITAAALPFAIASYFAIRFLGIAVLTLGPVIAWWLSRLPPAIRAWADRRELGGRTRERLREWTSASFWRVVLTATLAVLAPFAAIYALPHAQPPTNALNDRLPPGCHLFSPSNEAAAVLLTRPDVPVWMDGRADYWGRERLVEMNRLVYRSDPANPVPQGTTCILLPGPGVEPDFSNLVSNVDASPAWERVAEQNGYVLWLPADRP